MFQALDKCQLGDVLRAKDEKLDATGEFLTLSRKDSKNYEN